MVLALQPRGHGVTDGVRVMWRDLFRAVGGAGTSDYTRISARLGLDQRKRPEPRRSGHFLLPVPSRCGSPRAEHGHAGLLLIPDDPSQPVLRRGRRARHDVLTQELLVRFGTLPCAGLGFGLRGQSLDHGPCSNLQWIAVKKWISDPQHASAGTDRQEMAKVTNSWRFP